MENNNDISNQRNDSINVNNGMNSNNANIQNNITNNVSTMSNVTYSANYSANNLNEPKTVNFEIKKVNNVSSDEEKSKNKNNKLFKVLKIILLILIIQILALTYFLGTNKRIFNGVYVEGISLGGLTRSEANTYLEENLKAQIIDKNITFFYEDYEKTVALSSLIESIDYSKIAREAQQIGRTGNLFKRFMQVINLNNNPVELEVNFTVNMSKLREEVYSIKEHIDREAVSATMTKEHGKEFAITNEVIGTEMNVAKTIDYFRRVIESNEMYSYDYRLKVVVSDVIPKYTKDYYESFSYIFSSYMTEYKRSDNKRVEELTKLSKKLDGYILKQGEDFSFNEVLGKLEMDLKNESDINEENEKNDSKKDVKDKKVKDEEIIRENYKTINDDVRTQLVSTLYNAVLLADLEVLERHNLYQPPVYVNLGREAAICNDLDFKFKNITTNPIYIESYVTNGKLYIKIYGSKLSKRYDNVILSHKITKVLQPLDDEITVDNSLDVGEKIIKSEGESGYIVEVYGTYKKDGNRDKTAKISTNKYEPTASQILIGPDKKDEAKEENKDVEKEIDEDLKEDSDVHNDIYQKIDDAEKEEIKNDIYQKAY